MILTSVRHIDQLSEKAGGGKARGLSLLRSYGYKIPETFVITQNNRSEIEHFLDDLKDDKTYAVRSSAEGEDGAELSFAGQFISLLNLSGKDQLLSSIDACFESAKSINIQSYKKKHKANSQTIMNVIVQEMVSAKYSGVLFTADPVSQRHDLITVSITKGLGEELLSGHSAGEELSIFRHSTNLPESQILDEGLLKLLLKEALDIESKYGQPADMEWAIDHKGVLWWLQLRPITNLVEVHFNELDDRPLYESPLYTRGNIGEMMPGPVTPLTMSTFGRAIEVGLQVFYKKIGAIIEYTDENIFVHSYYNHLFFDVNALYQSTRNVLMSKKENVDMAVVGEIVPNLEVKMEVGYFKGLGNLISMIRYINSAPGAWKELKQLHDDFELNCSGKIEDCFRQIDKNLYILFDAYSLHYVTSSQSGSFYTTILNIHSKGKISERHHQEKVAKLYNNIPDVVGANVLKSLDELSHLLSRQQNIKSGFIEASDHKAIEYLTKSGPDEVVSSWKEFIETHGQRCVREAEMHEQEWGMNPIPVIEGLKTKAGLILNGFNGHTNGYAVMKTSLKGNGLNPFGKAIVRLLLPKARKAVARREQTKAWSIGIQYQFKKAYRELAKKMAAEKMLSDEDLIFFLKHEEIGKMISSQDWEYWNSKASARKKIYPELQELSFPDLNFGIPVPEEKQTEKMSGELIGIPVSRGIVEGKVRLVKSMSEARLLKKDEIMVAQFTDIGWTPFYSVVAGLVTEIGSPLSHGAVVAREYGLPAIVSMKGAMSSLTTGQKIRLDAIKGEVTVL